MIVALPVHECHLNSDAPSWGRKRITLPTPGTSAPSPFYQRLQQRGFRDRSNVRAAVLAVNTYFISPNEL